MIYFLVFVFLLASQAQADAVVALRTIRAKEVITADAVTIDPSQSAGEVSTLDEVVGQEARIALYPGRPIRVSDVQPPAIVDRNDHVTLVFTTGLLSITAEGRALGRGAAGEVIRAMNLSSRTTVSGQIRSDGKIEVK